MVSDYPTVVAKGRGIVHRRVGHPLANTTPRRILERAGGQKLSSPRCTLERYDSGMTKSKIAISLPRDQLARVQQEVRAGRAESVSGYITRMLTEEEKRESLRTLLRDLVKQHGAPEADDIKWAKRALAPQRG